jgi:hypothetical protein
VRTRGHTGGEPGAANTPRAGRSGCGKGAPEVPELLDPLAGADQHQAGCLDGLDRPVGFPFRQALGAPSFCQRFACRFSPRDCCSKRLADPVEPIGNRSVCRFPVLSLPPDSACSCWQSARAGFTIGSRSALPRLPVEP